MLSKTSRSRLRRIRHCRTSSPIVANAPTDTMFFLVRAFGRDQHRSVLNLLQALDVTVTEEPAGTFDVSQYAAAFLFDANGEGVTSRLTGFRNRYGAHFGDPMSIVIGRTGLPRAQFEASPLSAELADFLARAPWNDA